MGRLYRHTRASYLKSIRGPGFAQFTKMSTLFGRSKKHRSRTTSEGSDSLEGSSVPYASTINPPMPPPPLNNVRSSVYSVSSQLRPSPMLPEQARDTNDSTSLHSYDHKSYEADRSSESSRSRTPDILGMGRNLRRQQSAASTEDGRSNYSESISSSGTSQRKILTDRLLSEEDHRRRSTASTASSSAGSFSARGADSTPRASMSKQGPYRTAEERTSKSIQQMSDNSIPSTPSTRESALFLGPHSPSMRSMHAAAFPQYPYNQASTSSVAYSPPPSSIQQHSSTSTSSLTASRRSMNSHRSSSSISTTPTFPPPATPSMASTEFDFPRPANDIDIEVLFDELLERRSVPLKDRPAMASFPLRNKWALVYNDRLQEWQTSHKSPSSEDQHNHHQHSHPHRSSIASIIGPSSSSTAFSHHAGEATPKLEQSAAGLLAANSGIRVLRGKTETPEWYLQKVLNQTITPAEISSLAVGLRTYEIAWVRSFVELQGLSVLSNVLANITRLPVPRREQELKLELELLKTLKTLLNITVGRNLRRLIS